MDMTELEKLKQTSTWVRRLVFTIVSLIFVIALYGYSTEGVWWISVGGNQFDVLWESYPDIHLQLILIITPVVLVLISGVYYLQRLLLEMSRGLFFSNKCMHCLKWMAWLSLFGMLYNMFWPFLASIFINMHDTFEVNIRPLSLLTVLCLPVLVHLLSSAQALDKENKEII
jgi:hypothetical protein